MVSGKSLNHVTEIPPFQMEGFMNHGLHLNSLGKKKLTLLIAKCFGDKLCHLLAIRLLSPVQMPPLVKLKAKAQMCLKCMDCNYLEPRN
jgi:hypothetical protein